MAMLILEAIGPRGQKLAEDAASARGYAVGFDPELNSVTIDADGVTDEELERVISEELDGLDTEWRLHLRAVD